VHEVVVGCGCVIAEDGRCLLVRDAKSAARDLVEVVEASPLP
jgi:hypothetical protein